MEAGVPGRSAEDLDGRPVMAAGSHLESPLESLLDALDVAAGVRDAPPHVQAFVAWVDGHASVDALRALADESAPLTGAARTYQHVAVLGFAASERGLAAPHAPALVDGLTWLAGREWFVPGRLQTFEVDAVALLGVALGLAAAADPEYVAAPSPWMDAVLARAAAGLADPWERALVEAARYTLAPSDSAARRVAEAAPDLAVALAARGALPQVPDAEMAAFTLAADLSFRSYGPDRAAAQRAALRRVIHNAAVIRPGAPTVRDVVALLEGVSRGMRRWTWEGKSRTQGAGAVQWPINNEYHVQNLLWAVLAPVFPDLEDEENLPSFGQKHPRFDLGIPSLRLIIEVKFVRGGTTRDYTDVIDQIAADASLYDGDRRRYDRIVAFVWDDARHGEQHAELKQGLSKLRGVVASVVIARPGRIGPGAREAKRSGTVVPSGASSRRAK